MPKRAGIILFVILIIPLLIWVVLKTMVTHHHQDVNFYAPITGNPNAGSDSSTFGTGEVLLYDQSGKPFSPADFQGKHFLVQLAYAGCRDTCPKVFATLEEMQTKYMPEKDQVRFLTVYLNELSPERLSAEASRHKAEGDFWVFASGDSAEVAKWVQESLYPGEDQVEELKNFNLLRLVGKDGLYRGYDYNLFGPKTMDSLDVDLYRMLLHDAQSKK